MASKVAPSEERSAVKTELTKVADNTKAHVGLSHYAGICLWLGWFSFYFYLPFTMAILWYVSKPALGALIAFIVTLYLLPIDRELQPKV